MKIFQIVTLPELGGAQSVALNLANSLVDEHKVFVISGADGAMWNQLDKRVKQIKIKSLKRSISPLDFIVWIKLAYLGIRYRPDIVHLHSSKIGTLGRLAFPKGKIVYTLHGFDSIRIAFRRLLPIEKWLQKRTRTIVAVSEYDKNNLIEEGITNNIQIICNGIADKIEKNAPLLESARQIENEDKKFKILCIARLAPPKRFDLFCDVAKTLPDDVFFWVGNKYTPANIPKNVFCLGEIPNASSLNRYINLSILPSNYEGLPISIIESLSFSKPVVASDVGGISEILNGENGFAVNNTIEAFKEKIVFYKNNKDEYKKACLAARKSYEKMFTLNEMIDRYTEVYKQIANQK